MPKEIIVTIVVSIIQIPIAIWGATMPQERSKIPANTCAVSVLVTLVALSLYWYNFLSPDRPTKGAVLLQSLSAGA